MERIRFFGTVHEEKWFDKLNPLSHLTLRASYSLTGTPPDISYSNSTPIFLSYNPHRLFTEDKESAIGLDQLGNIDLTYEKKNELNLGVDFGLWRDRLNVTFDVYTRNNFDEMGPMITQGVGGEIVRAANVAEMHSNGMELSISSTNIKTKTSLGSPTSSTHIPRLRLQSYTTKVALSTLLAEMDLL